MPANVMLLRKAPSLSCHFLMLSAAKDTKVRSYRKEKGGGGVGDEERERGGIQTLGFFLKARIPFL